MSPVQRIADRYFVRMAVRQVCALPSFRNRTAALQDVSSQVLEAFVEGFWLPLHQGQLHKEAIFKGLVQKVKKLWEALKRAPKRLWEKFKKALGIERVTQLPGAIKELAAKGWKALRRILGKAFSVWPLKLFTLPEGASFGLNAVLGRIVAKFPNFERWLNEKAKPFLKSVDQWLRKYLPGVAPILFMAIYIWIWMNVVEFEWNFSDLVAGFTGALTLVDLFGSMPSSALGAIMNIFGFGTWTLLPVALAARILFCLAARIVIWRNGRFEVNRDEVAEVVGTTPEEIPT